MPAASHRPFRVLVLGADRAHSRTDRTFLAKLRIDVQATCPSGIQATEALLADPADAVLCDERLADMSGLEFLALTRLHPKLAAVPVILLSTDNTLESVLTAMDSGCSGYLIRPYSLRSFYRNLHRVLSPGEQAAAWSQEDGGEAFRMALEAFMPAADEPGQARERYARGAEHLAAGLVDKALDCFQDAARLDPDMAEAHEGMARAWKAKGMPERQREALQEASAALLRQGRNAEMDSALTKLNPDPTDPHRPVLDAAGKLLRRGDFQAAGEIYAHALALRAPEDRVLAHITRTCHFTPDPGHAARAVCQELHAAGAVLDAHKTFTRLMGPAELGDSLPRAGAGRPRPMNLLREALAVANYTFQAFRQNGAA